MLPHFICGFFSIISPSGECAFRTAWFCCLHRWDEMLFYPCCQWLVVCCLWWWSGVAGGAHPALPTPLAYRATGEVKSYLWSTFYQGLSRDHGRDRVNIYFFFLRNGTLLYLINVWVPWPQLTGWDGWDGTAVPPREVPWSRDKTWFLLPCFVHSSGWSREVKGFGGGGRVCHVCRHQLFHCVQIWVTIPCPCFIDSCITWYKATEVMATAGLSDWTIVKCWRTKWSSRRNTLVLFCPSGFTIYRFDKWNSLFCVFYRAFLYYTVRCVYARFCVFCVTCCVCMDTVCAF